MRGRGSVKELFPVIKGKSKGKEQPFKYYLNMEWNKIRHVIKFLKGEKITIIKAW